MKILQDFKCFPIKNDIKQKNKLIDFELTQYQQTKWKFYDQDIYFIESTIHWNMLLFYIYNNINKDNNLQFTLQKKNNYYYTLIVNIKEINKELESIIFLYFYHDMYNRNKNLLHHSQNIYKWNDLYLDIINKKILTNIKTNV